MSIKKFILILFFGIFFIHLVGAVTDISISVDNIFYEGDEVKFAYRFISTQDETINYFANVECPGSPTASLEMKEANLVANEYFQEVYSYGFVGENVKSGNCVASIFILEPYEKSFEKSFKIETLETFDFSLILTKKVFIQNEDIVINYTSEIENPSITATLNYPDNSSGQINLPYSFKAKQIGTYGLEVEVSKQGYKDISVKEQFGVIKSEADINFDETSDFYDGSKEANESKLFKNNSIFYIFGGSLILLILLIIIFFIVKKKKNLNSSSEL